MKIICKINNLNDISDPHTLERLKRYISKPDGEIDLDIGRAYNVYGVVFWDNCPWFYICPDNSDEYPKPFAADFFDTVDSRLPQNWMLCSFSNGQSEATTLLTFEEWAKDLSFYERLIDGEPEAIDIFTRYRTILDKA